MSAAVVVAAMHARLTEHRQRCPLSGGGITDKRHIASVNAGTGFYRKFTEALLRRYLRTSLDMGRCPSVLGNLTFRGKSSHSSARGLEDAVIFVHDIESCLKKLDRESRDLVARITLQEYTQEDVALMSGRSARSVQRKHADALDQLTEILLAVDLLEVGIH